ncbi:hypothetical protein [Hyalangium rubrum]|uniref:Lipoprotein n=1 Tax=Hyalangium rubrum TaxID=3103134 RepID=A0ABU5H0P6_9BACT|nr:hypothetical protein [Hyalangium sp. s54d21]MDY7226333.1 hypothetical protein [Hyalangium sp. s54d21]
MRSSVVRGCLALGVLAALSGCAGLRHQDALYQEAHRHVYPRPIEKVWPEVVKLVSSEGYPPRKGNQEFILLTEWRSDLQESRVVSSASRLYIEGHRVDRDTSVVRIFRQTIFTGDKGGMSARENRAGGSNLTVGAAGDISPFAEDPIQLNHMLGLTADHTSLTRGPAQMSRSVGRDGEMEWKLLQRVDFEAAKAIEARVTAREQQ